MLTTLQSAFHKKHFTMGKGGEGRGWEGEGKPHFHRITRVRTHAHNITKCVPTKNTSPWGRGRGEGRGGEGRGGGMGHPRPRLQEDSGGAWCATVDNKVAVAEAAQGW